MVEVSGYSIYAEDTLGGKRYIMDYYNTWMTGHHPHFSLLETWGELVAPH